MVNSEGEEHGEDSSQGGGAQLGGSGQVPTGTERYMPGLYCPVRQKAHESLEYLVYVLGLSSVAAFRTWMDSEAFAPYYFHLQANLERVAATAGRSFGRTLSHRNRLLVIQKAISDEMSGARRYIQLPVRDDGTFDAIDWHAVFLWQAVEHNLMRPTGPFYGKNMTLDDMQARIWVVLIRANKEARHRQREIQRSIRAQTI